MANAIDTKAKERLNSLIQETKDAIKAPFDSKGKKIAVFVIAYNASAKITETLDRIPNQIWEKVTEIFVIDDCSPDNTFEIANKYKSRRDNLRVIRNTKNKGYGGNQKVGYKYAIKQGYDLVVMLHADGQYAPEILGNILNPLVNNEADMVFGSRMAAGQNPLKGGMPFYKYIGNIVLTKIENFIAGMNLTEFHSGYRAYSCHALKELPFELNSDVWHFDTEILLQIHRFGYRIKEVPIPTYYGDEICHVEGIPYAINCIKSSLKYRFSVWKLWNNVKFDPESWKVYPYESKIKDAFSSQQRAITYGKSLAKKGHLLEIGPGSGVISSELKKNGFEVSVIESDTRYANRAKTYANNIYIGDIEKFDWTLVKEHKYDLIILADVLEHLRYSEAVLEKCVELLTEEGKVIISLPNVAHWSVRLQLLFGSFNYTDRGILDNTHLRFFTNKTAKKLIRFAGLKVIESKVTPIPLPLIIPILQKGHRLSFLQTINYFFTTWWKNLMGYQWVYFCEKIKGK